MPLSLDIAHFVKETQLQHGLRAENYARYQSYLSNRVATLRRQLHLANDKKKFLHRDVTPTNASDPRHLMLLVLYAERCWAESEAMTEVIQNAKRQGDGGAKPAGGVPPPEQPRKRLNKAVAWAHKLRAVADAVADECTKIGVEAYAAESEGRCALSHGRFADARDAFKRAAERCLALQKCSNETQWPIVLGKIGEIHDRVVYCMQCLGEDVNAYQMTAGDRNGDQQQFALTVTWNRRKLNIFSVKIKDVLREVERCEWAAAKLKAVEANAGPIPVGAQSKALEVVDRCIGLYNDALAHARLDLRAASDSQRQELQLLVHYLTYHSSLYALERTRFMIEVFERRYAATADVLRARKLSSSTATPVVKRQGGQQRELLPSQYASPLEVCRLYESAAEIVTEMSLLPGVAGRDDVESWLQEFKAGKLFFAAEAWRAAGDINTALAQYRAAAKTLGDVAVPSPTTLALSKKVQEGTVTLVAESIASKASEETPSSKCLADSLDEFAVASSVMKFPPDYQAVACKPVFVDIASTYIDYPTRDTQVSPAPEVSAGSQSQQNSTEAPAEGGDGQQKKGWGWAWGWGKGKQ